MSEGNNFKLDITKTQSDVNQNNPPLVFVHGVCHSSWCWQENYVPFFSRNGWDTYSFSLRGHGQSQGRNQLNQFGLTDYVYDLLSVIDILEEPPIVIGHSMGGIITQLLMSQFPQKISGAVLLATMPSGGVTFWETLRLFLSLKGMLNLSRLLKEKPIAAREVRKLPFFSGRIGIDQATQYMSLLQTESARALSEIPKFLTTGGSQSFPLLVLGSKQDLIFGRKAVERTAKHYNTQAIVLEEGCHDLMLDPLWEKSAQCILEWLQSSQFEKKP